MGFVTESAKTTGGVGDCNIPEHAVKLTTAATSEAVQLEASLSSISGASFVPVQHNYFI
jgi:hypothetical protein